ncbi:hypothetical protein [Caldimonas tepidiphila]|uniref:hypothetical protein n=1 Tax=Caldimonas tepidiphila TaxID=2315841 RepID=UPI0013002B5F|nr:hypothetical protein [Caldimonas tepidiphila]
MPTATITLTDQGDEIHVRLSFDPSCQDDSPAHGLALQCLMLINEKLGGETASAEG